MKPQASAGRATTGVVRTFTPVRCARSMPWATRFEADANGSSSRLRLCQGPAMMSSRNALSAGRSASVVRSPTITTPRRLNASSMRASATRVGGSASDSVVYMRNARPPAAGSSMKNSVPSALP